MPGPDSGQMPGEQRRERKRNPLYDLPEFETSDLNQALDEFFSRLKLTEDVEDLKAEISRGYEEAKKYWIKYPSNENRRASIHFGRGSVSASLDLKQVESKLEDLTQELLRSYNVDLYLYENDTMKVTRVTP